MGCHLGRGVGSARSGGRKKKKMKGRREGQWLGAWVDSEWRKR